MLFSKKTLFYAIVAFGLLCPSNFIYSQATINHGLLPVYNFSAKTYNAQEQNLAIAQDNRGLLYFANNSGILEYDGVSWRLIKLVNERVPRSLVTDSKGRVFVGSEKEFGYLAPDSVGNMDYVSLTMYIPEEFKEFREVWNVYAVKEEVIFQTDKALYIWNGKQIRIVPSNSKIQEFFYTGTELIARLEGKGLCIFKNDTFIPIPGGDFFSGKQVFGAVRIDSSTLLIATGNEGLFTLKTDKSELSVPKKFSTDADAYFKSFNIFNIARPAENLISIGTWGGGIVVTDLQGKIKSILDKESGLQDPIILDQLTDAAGNTWLALSKGISRTELSSPVSLFNNQQGLQGTVQAITRFKNRIYAATNIGVFYLDYTSRNINGNAIKEPVFKAIGNFTSECWDLLNFTCNGHEILLVVTNSNISIIQPDNSLKPIFNGAVYDIYQSRLDPARIYVGMEEGITSLHFDNGKWTQEEKVKGIDETISSITEDQNGNLWMGTLNQGVVKININSLEGNKIKNIEIIKYDSLNGLPSGPTLVSNISGRTIIGTSEGIYKFQPYQNTFIPDSAFGDYFIKHTPYIHRISEQKGNKVWLVTVDEKTNKYITGNLLYIPGKDFEWQTQPYALISKSIQHAIYIDANGICWFGGPEGLYRYNSNIRKNYETVYHTLIRKVTIGEDSLIFGGAGFDDEMESSLLQPPILQPELSYSFNSLKFDFSALSSENESDMSYSYILDGYEKKWSEWSSQNKKEYTNLNEGSYILRVKSKNIYGNEGTEADFAFTILSPWYRTIFAYISYVILLAIFIYVIVKVYTRSLRSIIQERTAEVVRQKNEIELKNKEITDSIHYASRIQSAILPPEEYIGNIINEHFILYKPRDIVSGDFYWMHSEKNKLITVTADCTGHGVPGAFMSMLGVAFLNEIIIRHEDNTSDKILNELRSYVIKSLRQTGREGENQDGMDISLCIYDFTDMSLQFSGANNPLYLFRNGELIIYPADNMPIGIHTRHTEDFTRHDIKIQKGDMIYTFSDGYVDQFGGPKGKKYMSKNFKDLLLRIHKESVAEQKMLLNREINDWMENYSQVDDILVMGIRI
ncbi:MAG: SpoIIE family protein phosphatase [Bacteroidales bacterium]|nr:SpoIIE family protein phosphatase [Bacteroidales bacterium]MCB9012524.1 SpoIIE family protein phosphatase [Bacteroidales bacterium]